MKKRLISLAVLVVLLVLPTALYAQETEPEAVVTAVFEAINAGDIEAALAYYADDAVVEIVPFATHTGIEEIRAYFEGNAELNAALEYENFQVEGDTVTVTVRYTDDDLRALDLNLEGIEVVTLQDGKIVAETWTATDETMAALEAAMAALPETGGEILPIHALVIALGGLSIAGGWCAESLRRRSRQV
jgi:ketosteroid isomerase-like protein